MKKLFTILVLILLNVGMWAQSPPQKMSYQAILRNSSNALIVSTQVGMQISILQASAMGGSAPVYVETQNPTTNINGMVSIEIGAGTVISGTFSAIDWANGPFYIKTDTDPNPTSSGFNYSITGTNQLLSVPYALYAGTSGSGGSGHYWKLHGNSTTLDNGTYFIGTTNGIPLNIKVNNQKAGRIDHLLFNTFFGYQSGNANNTGYGNTAIGFKSLLSNTTGNRNAANGGSALSANTTGYFNTANGYHALVYNTTGNQNTANGTSSLGSNTIGNNNTADGLDALFSNTTGSDNTAIGYFALFSTIASNGNTALGNNAGDNNINNGDYNTFIGYDAYADKAGYTNTTALGYGAKTTSSNQIRLGNANVSSLYFGTANNLAITTDSIPNMYYDYATGQIMRSTVLANNSANNWSLTGNAATSAGPNFLGTTDLEPLMFKVNSIESGLIDYDPNKANTFLGFQTGLNNTGFYNTAMGYVALSSNTTGDENTATGYSALGSNTIGSWNTATGFKSLVSNTTGIRNVANGRNSLFSNTTGQKNTATGDTSMQDNTTGNQNTANGTSSMAYNITGNYNTAMGVTSLYFNTTGSDNTAFGYASLYSTTASSGNTALGKNAGNNNINNGNNNTFLGYNAFADKAGYTNTTALGYGAMTTSSNQVRIGNANVNALYFGTADNIAVTTDSIPNMYYDYATGQIMRSTVLANNSANSWNLTGNANTVDNTNFIGTTDNVPLSFKVNNIFAGRIDNMLGNVFFGSASGINNNTTASSNTAIGYFALNTNISGTSNTALGANALQLNTGGYNTAIGGGALANNSTGSLNVAVGKQALMMTTTGTKNTALGANAYMTGTLTNSTVIGYGAQTTVSNTIQLGNANVNALYFGTANNLATTTDASNMYYDNATGQIMRSIASGSGSTHAIGDSFGGGIVFYVDADGQHGLIAATADQSTGIQWYNGSFVDTNAIRDGLNAGMSNTERIIIKQGSGSYAAQSCANYQGGNFGDWYLPSKYELNLLYIERATVGGFSTFTYLSSNRYDNVNAWVQNFSSVGLQAGSQTAGATNTPLYVRAIRSF